MNRRIFNRTLILLILLWSIHSLPSSNASQIFTKQPKSCGIEKGQLISVINTQMAAFRSKNLPKAYSVTSKLFKSKFSQKDFSNLIQKYYPLLLVNTRVAPGLCLRDGNQAQIIVQVFDAKNNNLALNYKLGFEKGMWAIDGAVQIENGNLSGI